jgi:phospholipid:diacylglycerol acyltransferase
MASTVARPLNEEGRCAAGTFRSRVWTQTNMARSFLLGRLCWMRHLSLNFTTGLDPDGIRIRNSQGLDAIDFFFPGVPS